MALPILVLNVLKGTPATFGFIGAAAGLGEVVGGLLVGNLKIGRVGVRIYAFSGLLGVGFAGYGIAPLLPVVLVAAFTFAVSIVVANTLWESALQKHVPRRLLGRVNSVDNFGSFLVAPVAPIFAAAAIGRVGPGAIFLVGGAVALAWWGGALLLVRSARELR